ncbi:g10126 [Coccomyxa elongata]
MARASAPTALQPQLQMVELLPWGPTPPGSLGVRAALPHGKDERVKVPYDDLVFVVTGTRRSTAARASEACTARSRA